MVKTYLSCVWLYMRYVVHSAWYGFDYKIDTLAFKIHNLSLDIQQ